MSSLTQPIMLHHSDNIVYFQPLSQFNTRSSHDRTFWLLSYLQDLFYHYICLLHCLCFTAVHVISL